MFSFVPAASWRSSNTKIKDVWKPGVFLCFNATRGSLLLPGLCSLFHVISSSPLSPTRVLLDVCTLLQLSLGLNFGISLSLAVDWRRRGFRFQVALMWLKSSGCLRDSIFFLNLASHSRCRFVPFAISLNELVLPTVYSHVTRQYASHPPRQCRGQPKHFIYRGLTGCAPEF